LLCSPRRLGRFVWPPTDLRRTKSARPARWLRDYSRWIRRRSQRAARTRLPRSAGRSLFGGFIFGFGWFAGLILLWSSRARTTREKWIGTLVIPGGLATSLLVGLIVNISLGLPTKQICRGIAGGAQHCTNASGASTGSSILAIAVFAVLVLAPIATSIYLARRAAKP